MNDTLMSRIQITTYNRLVGEVVAPMRFLSDRFWPLWSQSMYDAKLPIGGSVQALVTTPRSFQVPVGACVECGSEAPCSHDVVLP